MCPFTLSLPGLVRPSLVPAGASRFRGEAGRKLRVTGGERAGGSCAKGLTRPRWGQEAAEPAGFRWREPVHEWNAPREAGRDRRVAGGGASWRLVPKGDTPGDAVLVG